MAEGMPMTITDNGRGFPVTVTNLARGHVTYADSVVSVGSAQAITANTRTQLTIDGNGAQTELRWKGSLPDDVWSSNVNNIAQIGQHYICRVSMKVRKTGVSTDARFILTQDIGSDPLDTDSIIIEFRDRLLVKAQNVEQNISWSWAGYGKETFLANGCRFYIECDENIEVWEKEIFICDLGVPLIGS